MNNVVLKTLCSFEFSYKSDPTYCVLGYCIGYYLSTDYIDPSYIFTCDTPLYIKNTTYGKHNVKYNNIKIKNGKLVNKKRKFINIETFGIDYNFNLICFNNKNKKNMAVRMYVFENNSINDNFNTEMYQLMFGLGFHKKTHHYDTDVNQIPLIIFK